MSRKGWTIVIVAVALGALLVCGALAAVAGYVYLARPADKASAVQVTPLSTREAGPVNGELHLVGSLPPTLDPALVQDSTSGEYVVHLFSGLVSLNADLEIVPALAERWEMSADGRVYTFSLHPDAAFGDGKPITAQEVVDSLSRACSPDLASPVALSYLGDIVGAEEYSLGQAESIQGLEVVDEHTLRITIDSPKSYFLAKLTYPTAAVVDLEEVEREPQTWFTDPNPSGPFGLEELSKERIVLARNDRYVGKQASITRAVYDLSASSPMTQYETGEIDITAFGGDEIDRVLDPYNPLHNEYVGFPELSVQYLGLNVEQAPFDDPLVRRAFAYAIDREKLANLVLNQTALPAYTVLPPTMPGYTESAPGTVPTYDPEEARRLLAASSYGSADRLPPIALTVAGTTGYLSPVDEAVMAMIEESLGIAMTAEQVDWADMLEDMNRQRYQLYSAGWIADYPDPQNFIDVQFYSKSAQNHTGYANSEVDALLEKARVEQDEGRRSELYAEAERIVLNDAPWITLTHGYAYYLVKPYVQGFRGDAALYPWLCDITIVD
ncbi:MAG: peptide ABC transporter substrate-binding protein [Anaerolineales bacterium]